jgi:hypothetical protein
MAPWTFDVKFPHGTEVTFGSLTFAVGEDEELKMLSPGPASEYPALAPSSALVGSCSGLDPCACLYTHTVKLVRDIPVVTSIFQLLVGASSPSSSTSTLDQDSSDDYPKIRTSTCEEPVEGGCLVLMVAPNGDRSNNISSRYPTIGRSEALDARTLSAGLVQNLNPDFNIIQVQAIMETIPCMAPDGSPLAVLAQQGAETANLVVAEKSAGVPQREPSLGDNDRARHA